MRTNLSRIVIGGVVSSTLAWSQESSPSATPPHDFSSGVISPQASFITPTATEAAHSLRAVLERFREFRRQEPVDTVGVLRAIVAGQRPDGSWPEVNYADRTSVTWKAADHLKLLRRLALAWDRPDHVLHHDPTVTDAIARGLRSWAQLKLRNGNWWWNNIGAPSIARDVVVLMEPGLTDETREIGIRLIEESVNDENYKKNEAANLVWMLAPAIHAACLRGQSDVIAQFSSMLSKDLASRRYIRPDGSYFAHGNRLYNFGYGDNHFRVFSELAWELRQTPWAISRPAVAAMSDSLLNCTQWLIRGTAITPAGIDRQVSWRDNLAYTSTLCMLDGIPTGVPYPWVATWRDLDPERTTETQAYLDRLTGKIPPMVGFRFLPHGDFAAHHRPRFSFMLKILTERSLGMEACTGHAPSALNWVNTGDYYILRDGNDYLNLQPVWDLVAPAGADD